MVVSNGIALKLRVCRRLRFRLNVVVIVDLLGVRCICFALLCCLLRWSGFIGLVWTDRSCLTTISIFSLYAIGSTVSAMRLKCPG